MSERPEPDAKAVSERPEPDAKAVSERPEHDAKAVSERAPHDANELGEEAITCRAIEACVRRGLHGDDVFLVMALLERPESTWPACCETGCEPCMKTLHAAAREALGLTPTG